MSTVTVVMDVFLRFSILLGNIPVGVNLCLPALLAYVLRPVASWGTLFFMLENIITCNTLRRSCSSWFSKIFETKIKAYNIVQSSLIF